jgi:Domain of unknown function (DUF4150)/GHH signature containing HNH/Endo VII superfamily nuclease toxin  2
VANEVYANGMEVACKAAAGKTVAAMPDVCLSPPSPPAGPIPIPYPNTAYASDTTNGSKTVQISGQEVVLKDKSTFKKSTGDEAATKSLGMGVVSHQIQGEINFTSWSMDVKIEGENAARHLDLTLHNEMCIPANTPPWPYTDEMMIAPGGVCHEAAERIKANCNPEKEWKKNCPPPPADVRRLSGAELRNYIKSAKANKCIKARKCMLIRYGSQKTQKGCCRGQTGHHLVPEESFKQFANYNPRSAPVICAEGPNHSVGTHGQLHGIQSYGMRQSGKRSLAYMQKAGAGAVRAVFPECGCNPRCTEAQLKKYHEDQAGIPPDASLNPVTPQHPTTSEVRTIVQEAKGALS